MEEQQRKIKAAFPRTNIEFSHYSFKNSVWNIERLNVVFTDYEYCRTFILDANDNVELFIRDRLRWKC